MPFITVNGQLQQVSQAEFDDWNKAPESSTVSPAAGQPDSTTTGTPAGGSVVQLSNTQEILIPNTASTSPGQTLSTQAERTVNEPAGVFTAVTSPVITPTITATPQQLPGTLVVEGDLVSNYPPLSVTPGPLPDWYTKPNASGPDETPAPALTAAPAPVTPNPNGDPNPNAVITPGTGTNPVANVDISQKAATLAKAKEQASVKDQRRDPNNGDWRVKLRLAPQANYLYAAENPGILAPLKKQGGVIFPYTPTISTGYKANYSPVDLTHSNYKGYYYQGSSVDAVTLSCPFTAQSSVEADYLLAVIHFFKAVTKMFYGQDGERGTPPPLVYLTGLGEYQFNEHPCVVQSFTYELPTDVDYIRARSRNINHSNMLNQRQASNALTPGTTWGKGILGPLFGGAINRIANAGLPKGGITKQPAPKTLGLESPTYVPTKINLSISLLPVQSRKQQSQQFSLKQYANGDLLKGGFW
jgi:hypothetical protein